MNDVQDICQRILQRPSPPMRDSTQVLTIARRSARRQVRITVTASALVAAAIVAVTAMAGTLHAATRTPRPAVLLTAVAIPSLSHTPPRSEPHPDLARLLADALPAGYHGRPAAGSRGTLIVSAGGGEGRLSATVVRDNTAAPSGDLCAPGVTARLIPHLPAGTFGCRMIIIDGVPVRVGATPEGSTASRFLADGFLTIDWNPKGAALFTMDQLAEVAARTRVAG